MTTKELESWKIKFFKDKIMMKIFEKIMDSPKSAIQISYESGIPLPTVYRKLKDLNEKDLLKISGTMIDEKHRIKLFMKNERLTEMIEND